MSDILKGCVERITFYNPQNSFTVAKLICRGQQELVSVVGTMPAVQPGESVRCQGKWHNHPQHGRQFLIEVASVEAPADVVGIQKYLQSGLVRGIGPIYAERIVKRFGENTLDILDASPNRLLEIEGIGKGRLAKVVACWNQQRAIREVMVFLQTFGISPAYAQRIYKVLGADSIPSVRQDPYRLARDIHGIGFKTADSVAQKMGIALDSPTRVEAGIEYVLSTLSEEGHVCYPCAELVQTASDVLEVSSDLVATSQAQLIDSGRLVAASGMIWKKTLHLSETGIAREVHRLLTTQCCLRGVDRERALSWVQDHLTLKLAPQQQVAVQTALGGKILVVTGGPGTGKSTIIRVILAIIGKLTHRILLAAPTGRAAKRMTEITSRQAQTIHALLEWDFKIGAFRKGLADPLACDLLIVDEASMIDTVLAYSLLKAIPDGSRLILVGDVNQLPSVGPGNVLQDIIRSDLVDVVQLTEIFRQARGSQIVVNAHRVNSGKFPYLKQGVHSDFFFLEQEDPQEVQRTILDLVTRRLPNRYRLEPLGEIQVLAPMKRGVIGTQQLNIALQAALNPQGSPLFQFGREYREGDKVMQMKNNYDKNVYNGDIGLIEHIQTTEHLVQIRFDHRLVPYAFMELDEVQLAYAISIHKSQGSEYPCVIIPVHTTHFKLLHRNLIYTGITRGKRLVVLVGTKKALAIAIANDAVQKRHTGLTNALLGKGQKRPSEHRAPH